MSGAHSKRQQARNERALQDLIKSVPGNDTCADCGARSPGWASWSLGVFLCMRCAAIHRKLGTHISKVKSLSMDSWSTEQVENMKLIGNLASNRKYNPQNTRPQMPIDVDEADSAMERFIRQKYAKDSKEEGWASRRAGDSSRHAHTYSTDSDDQGPPLPAKTSSKFSFRSASSIFPMSSKAKREAAARAHLEAERRDREEREERAPTPPPRNKPSKVFGQHVGANDSGVDDLEPKLAQLRDMGFTDEKRNITVLKGLNGNLQKSIETLVRLGEGSGLSTRARTPVSAGLTQGLSAGLANASGLSFQRTREKTPASPSNNPWELSGPAPPQSAQSTGGLGTQPLPNGNQLNGNNPFGLMATKSQYSLNQQYQMDQPFQTPSLASQQPLFPNHTGGAPNRQPHHVSAVPPMPTIPQGQYQDASNQQYSQQPSQTYNPFQQQPQQLQAPPSQQNNTFSNPYGQQERAQTFPPQNGYENSMQGQQAWYGNQNPQAQQVPQQQQTNPFGFQGQQASQNSQSGQSNPFFSPQQGITQPSQQQNNPYGQQYQQYSQTQMPQQQQQQPQQPQSNPYAAQPQYGMQQQQPQQYAQYQAQPQPIMPQQTGRADKSSILALYSLPQLAPTPAPQQFPASDPNQIQQNQGPFGPQSPGMQPQQTRSVSSPLATFTASTRNPFMSAGGNTPQGYNQMANGQQLLNGQTGMGHASRESMAIDAGGWHGQNGRHSPDAFANLSARSFR